ncbi:MAG: carbonic anhydrase [Methylovirgula sp.]
MSTSRRSFLAGLIACPICASLARAEDHAHWSYEGATGPTDWGKLEKDYAVCTIGKQQSPVDLRGATKTKLKALGFDWKAQAFSVANNGHTIQAAVPDGSSLTLDGAPFALKQFHFHTPSEHAINGKRSAMEAHFVHANDKGTLAVVGMMMRAGKSNPAFKAVMAAAPKQAGSANMSASLDPNLFLPKNRGFYRYQGSLTTPPCSETVIWNVFAQEIEVAAADIAAFRTLFAMNARPLQPPYGRKLVYSA